MNKSFTVLGNAHLIKQFLEDIRIKGYEFKGNEFILQIFLKYFEVAAEADKSHYDLDTQYKDALDHYKQLELDDIADKGANSVLNDLMYKAFTHTYQYEKQQEEKEKVERAYREKVERMAEGFWEKGGIRIIHINRVDYLQPPPGFKLSSSDVIGVIDHNRKESAKEYGFKLTNPNTEEMLEKLASFYTPKEDSLNMGFLTYVTNDKEKIHSIDTEVFAVRGTGIQKMTLLEALQMQDVIIFAREENANKCAYDRHVERLKKVYKQK